MAVYKTVVFCIQVTFQKYNEKSLKMNNIVRVSYICDEKENKKREPMLY